MNESKNIRSPGLRLILEENFEATEKPILKDLQILRTGKFSDPRYGKFSITSKMFSEMINNFNEGVRGIVPALDYAHDTEGRAAGWLKKLFIKDSGKEQELWGSFELTPGGQRCLADKDYAYLSADFNDSYVDNEAGKKYGCVLLGAALTNRPVIKKMSPAVQLSESELADGDALGKKIALLVKEGYPQDQAVAIAYSMQKKGELAEGAKMDHYSEEDKKKLADHEKMCADMGKLMKEMDAKSFDEVMSKIAELKGKKADTGGSDMDQDDKKQMSEMKTSLEKSQTELSELKVKLALNEKESEFTKLLTEGKAVEAQRKAFMDGDVAEFAKHAKFVKLSEGGHNENPTENTEDVDDQIRTEAKKLCEADKKLSMRDAYAQVLKTNKTLADKRREKMEA